MTLLCILTCPAEQRAVVCRGWVTTVQMQAVVLQVLREVARCKAPIVRRRMYQLHILDLLLRELNLEHEVSQQQQPQATPAPMSSAASAGTELHAGPFKRGQGQGALHICCASLITPYAFNTACAALAKLLAFLCSAGSRQTSPVRSASGQLLRVPTLQLLPARSADVGKLSSTPCAGIGKPGTPAVPSLALPAASGVHFTAVHPAAAP